MDRRRQANRAAAFASACALAMIAQQVGSKATRDAVYLSHWDVTTLPTMMAATAAISLIVVIASTRLMGAKGPAKVVPWAFGLSAVAYLLEALLLARAPKLGAILVYIHVGCFGAVLISGFWSLFNERFDPRSAKERIGWIAAAGTLGGLIGGLLANRVAALYDMSHMLPILAAFHLLCAFIVLGVRGTGVDVESSASGEALDTALGLRVLKKVGYLRLLAILVILGATSAALIDYVFKQEVSSRYDGNELLGFFANFYMIVGLATFVVQATVGRLALRRLGLARTVALMPLGVTVGSLVSLAFPGLRSATLLRGGQSTLQSSVFRSGYELLYTPIPPREKRATKALVDVGFDRLGDAVGAGIVRIVLALVPAMAASVLLVGAAALGVLSLGIARQLQRGYVRALEKSLMIQAGRKPLPPILASTHQSLVGGQVSSSELELAMTNQTLLDLPVMSTWGEGQQLDAGTDAPAGELSDLIDSAPSALELPKKKTAEAAAAVSQEPLVRRILDLRSGDADRIRRALGEEPQLDANLVSHTVVLLAWDEVYKEAIRALRTVADRVPGQLVDALLDRHEEFAIRRRIPRVLSVVDDARAVEGLFEGLKDRRFEVRFQCGRALSVIDERNADGAVSFSREKVFDAVQREVGVDLQVWQSQRLLDRAEERAEGAGEQTALYDEFIRYRSSRSMEHVFTLLSLSLPKEPLRVAFRGLHTDDPALRGTALEYLESVLPSRIRASLWPFLEDHRPAGTRGQPRPAVLEELLRSQISIELNLQELRDRIDDSKK